MSELKELKEIEVEMPKHVMNVKPNYYDAILRGSFRIRGKAFADGDLIVYHEIDTPVGVSPRPPLRRRLRLEQNEE